MTSYSVKMETKNIKEIYYSLISVERVDKFCYLGEMLGEEEGAELAVVNRVGRA